MHHYHLAATKVAFLEPENEAIGSFELNVMMRTDERNITTADLARAQQVAQLQFFDKLQNPNLVVKDVFFIGISYLGHMTEEKFQTPPKGVKVQERVDPPAPGTEVDHFAPAPKP